MYSIQFDEPPPEAPAPFPDNGHHDEPIPADYPYNPYPDAQHEIEMSEDASPVTPRIAALENTSLVLEPVRETDTGRIAQAPEGSSVRLTALHTKYIAVTLSKTALSLLLSLFLFAFILAFILLTAARPGSAANAVKKADITWLLEETDIGNVIIDGLNASSLIKIEVDASVINRFLRRENVATEVGRVAEGYARAIAEANYDYYMSSRDITNFLRAVAPDIHDEFGIDLTDADYGVISDSVNNYVDLRDYSIGKLLGNTGMDAATPYMLLSVYPLIIAGLLGILVLFDIFLVHRKRIRTAFLFTGISLALSGVICFLAAMLFGPYSGLFSSSSFYGIVKMIVGVASSLAIPGLICLATGVISIAAFAVINKKRAQDIMQMDSGRSDTKIWRITGLITNASILLISSAFTLLFFLNMPI